MSDSTLEDDDDLSQTQEYFIAGTVILLFGLLYWFLNSGWNSHTTLAVQNSAPVTTVSTLPAATPIPLSSFSADAERGMTGDTEREADNDAPRADATMVVNASPTVIQTTEVDTASITTDIAEQTMEAPAEQATAMTQPVEAPAEQAAAVTPVIAIAATKIPQTQTIIEPATPKRSAYALPDGTPVDITSGAAAKLRNVLLSKTLNKPVTFEDIRFTQGSAILKPESDSSILAIAALLNGYPDANVLIRGHTDHVGEATDNTRLSLMRASTLGNALVKLGIAKPRIIIMGMGDQEPLANNDSEQGRSRNRRVDVSITQ